jgi:FtsP/CotA-like multicopper oxidase with cupredoxin domain
MADARWYVLPSSAARILAAFCLTIGATAGGSLASEGDRGGQECKKITSEAGSPSAFPRPEVRESSGGVLKTTLHACIATNKIVDQPTGDVRVIHTPTYEGSIPGPTLIVEPGDKLSIDLVNDLPANPKDQRGGAFLKNPYTTNFHTHGLSVSPLGISDNVLREMEPGTTNAIEIDIPADHPSGTFWYHPHQHGAVTYQINAGMAGFLIIKGGAGTLDAVPEVAAAQDVPMAFQVIKTGLDGNMPFVNQKAEQFGTFPFGTTDLKQQGVWSTYGLDGAPGRSFFYYTTNGVTNPTLHMRPGEVQRWRLLNASEGDNLLIALEGHGLNIIAMDGITVPNMYQLKPGSPIVMAPGQRMDVLVKAGDPGTYKLQTLDPSTYDEKVVPHTMASVSPSGIDAAARTSRHSFDFPVPCGAPVPASATPNQGHKHADAPPPDPTDPCNLTPPTKLSYPVTFATVIVDGDPVDMKLPAGPLPVPQGLPSVAKMLSEPPAAVRHVAFEICGNKAGTIMHDPGFRLPACGWYFEKYDAKYWGGAPFNVLLMMRDDDDKGKPSDPPDKNMPLVDFKKDGLFNGAEPLFDDMIAGNYEEWTVTNRSFSDHPFHIHQNPFLVTKINGKELATPEWHDTFIVPGATPQPTNFLPPPPQPNINKDVGFGSITFRIYFSPRTVGCFVMHCHTLSHEDLGMMQRLDILPAPGQPSGCAVPTMDH